MSDALNVIATDELASALKPRLKLFFSADIVGSTAYKQPLNLSQDDADHSIKWAKTIQNFYSVMRDEFAQKCGAVDAVALEASGGTTGAGATPNFWKTIGDEVVFWKELRADEEVWLVLIAWVNTLQSMRQEFQEAKLGLDVKSTVWCAGFPVRNRPVIADQQLESTDAPAFDALSDIYDHYDSSSDRPAPQSRLDFIGPGIDVGFRLTGLSSNKKMTISLDVAYLLTASREKIGALENLIAPERVLKLLPQETGLEGSKATPGKRFETVLQIYYSGDRELKGALGGIQYPHLWINTTPHGTLTQARDRLYAIDRRPLSWDDLKKFCDLFYEDRSRFIGRPFLNYSDSIFLCNLTDQFRAFHEKFVEKWPGRRGPPPATA